MKLLLLFREMFKRYRLRIRHASINTNVIRDGSCCIEVLCESCNTSLYYNNELVEEHCFQTRFCPTCGKGYTLALYAYESDKDGNSLELQKQVQDKAKG